MKTERNIVLALWAISVAAIPLAESPYFSVDAGLGLTMLTIFVIWPLTGVLTAILVLASVLNASESPVDNNLQAEQNESKPSTSKTSKATLGHHVRPLLTKLIAFFSVLLALTVVAIPLTLLFDVRLPDSLSSSSPYPLGLRLLAQALPAEIIIILFLIVIHRTRRYDEK